MATSASSQNVAEKLYSDLVVGDRIWMNGILLRVTKILPVVGNISRFETVMALPLGTEFPVQYSGLSYGTVRVEVGEGLRAGADRRSA